MKIIRMTLIKGRQLTVPGPEPAPQAIPSGSRT